MLVVVGGGKERCFLNISLLLGLQGEGLYNMFSHSPKYYCMRKTYYSFVGLLSYEIVSWGFIYFIQNIFTDDFKNHHSYTEPNIIYQNYEKTPMERYLILEEEIILYLIKCCTVINVVFKAKRGGLRAQNSIFRLCYKNVPGL